MPQPPLDVFRQEGELLENFRVRLEFDQRAVRRIQFAFLLLFQPSLFEGGFGEFAAGWQALPCPSTGPRPIR